MSEVATAHIQVPVDPDDLTQGSIDIALFDVQSTNVARIGYDESAKVCVVQFRNGSCYRIADFPPELWAVFQSAASKGSFFHRNIRTQFAESTSRLEAAPQPCAPPKRIEAFTKDHPECRDDEVYLGNYTHAESQRINWRTKRAGFQAYYPDGTPYPNQVREGVQPYFVKEAEWTQGALIVPAESTEPTT